MQTVDVLTGQTLRTYGGTRLQNYTSVSTPYTMMTAYGGDPSCSFAADTPALQALMGKVVRSYRISGILNVPSGYLYGYSVLADIGYRDGGANYINVAGPGEVPFSIDRAPLDGNLPLLRLAWPYADQINNNAFRIRFARPNSAGQRRIIVPSLFLTLFEVDVDEVPGWLLDGGTEQSAVQGQPHDIEITAKYPSGEPVQGARFCIPERNFLYTSEAPVEWYRGIPMHMSAPTDSSGRTTIRITCTEEAAQESPLGITVYARTDNNGGVEYADSEIIAPSWVNIDLYVSPASTSCFWTNLVGVTQGC